MTAQSASWRPLLRDAVRLDRSALALVPAARCAVGIAVPLVAGDLSGHLLVGVGAAVGALTAGMASLQGTYRTRVRIMALAAAGFALSAFVGATIGHVQVPDIAVTAVWGFAAGLLVMFGQAPSVVGLQAVIGLVVYSQFDVGPGAAALDALWALCGGTLQIVLVAVIWPLQRFPAERSACSAAYRLLAAHARSLATDPSALLDPTALDQLRSALVDPQPFGDPTEAAAFQALADEAERIRLELAGIARTRARLTTTPPTTTSPTTTPPTTTPTTRVGEPAHLLDTAIIASANVLAEVADALHDGRSVAAASDDRDRFRSTIEQLQSAGDSAERWDEAVLRQATTGLVALAGQLRAVLQLTAVAAGEQPTPIPPAHRAVDAAPTSTSAPAPAPSPSPAPAPAPAPASIGVGAPGSTRPRWRPLPRRERMRDQLEAVQANLTLTSEAFRHALRVGVTLSAAVAISHLFPLGHGYWLPMTVMIVLKPDFAATFSRGLARSVGTLLGAGLVTLVLAGVRPPPAGLIALTVALYAVSIAVLRANYAVYSVSIASLVVVLLGFTGSPALSLAADRSFYTVLGAALALVAYAVWPTWERGRVLDRLADLVETDGRYGAALIRAWADPATANRADLDRLRRAARLARSNAEASVDRWLKEPAGRGPASPNLIDAEKVQGILAEVRRYVWGALALHGQLPSDGSTRPDVDSLGGEVEHALATVAAALRTPAAQGTYPHLRATHVELAARLMRASSDDGSDPALTHRDMVLISETDLMVNAVDTLAHLVGVGPS